MWVMTQKFYLLSAAVQFCLTELLSVRIKEMNSNFQVKKKKTFCDQLTHSPSEK